VTANVAFRRKIHRHRIFSTFPEKSEKKKFQTNSSLLQHQRLYEGLVFNYRKISYRQD